MTLKWALLVLVQYETIVITSQSIAGVTYMDDFDFEERYRDANECNPLYWHPLHLPAYCMDAFEKLIRSRLATNLPVKITRVKQNKIKYKNKSKKKRLNKDYDKEEEGRGRLYYGLPYPVLEMDSEEYYQAYSKTVRLTPYEEMLELLKEDIKKGPSSPTVTVMPNLGPVALYKQAVSKKSVNMIKALAEGYVKAIRKVYDDYYAAYGNYPSEPNIFVYDSAKNKTNVEEEIKDKKNKKEKEETKKKEKKEKKNKVYRLKTKHGNVVTIIETKNLDLMKKEDLKL